MLKSLIDFILVFLMMHDLNANNRVFTTLQIREYKNKHYFAKIKHDKKN